VTLPELSARRIVLVTMAFMGVVVFGLVSWMKLPRDLFPEMEPPVISVITTYSGASAEDVENKVTRIVENNLAIVSNLKKLTSTSSEGLSTVTCEFEWSTNLDEASNDIRDRLEFAKQLLPDDVEAPMLFKFNTAMFPVAVYGATANESYPQLNRILDKEVGDQLKRVEGVGAVQVFGGMVRQINVTLDRAKMDAAGLTPAQVAACIAGENYMLPAGSVKVGAREYQLRVPGEFKTVEEISKTVIKAQQGSRVLCLADLGEVRDAFEEQTREVRVDGRQGAIFIIQKRSGTNTVEVLKRVHAKLSEIEPRLPRDVTLKEIFNSARFIERSLGDLSEATLVAGLLVVLVTLFMLRRVRASLIVLTAIPTSLIAAFGGLYVLGFTINVVSLFAIAITVGMVVDDAIVVVDNVTRHLERGERPHEAAVFGTNEVISAVMASTFTTMVVFVPLFFVRGMTRIFFSQLGVVLIVTLGCSLAVALTLTPALCSRIMKREREMHKPKTWGIFVLGGKLLDFLENAYARVLGAALAHRWAVGLVAVGVLLLTIPAIAKVGKEFVPEQDTGDISITVELAVGTRLEKTLQAGDQALAILKEECGEALQRSYLNCGIDRKVHGARFGAEGANIFSMGGKLVPKDQRKKSVKDLANAVRERILKTPGLCKLTVSTQNPMDRMLMGGGKPIQVEIVGHDLAATDHLAVQVRDIMLRTPGAKEPSISRETGKPEIQVRVNRELASQKGVSTRMLAETLRDHVYGSTAGQFRVGGDDWDIFLQLAERDRKSIEDIRQMPIPTVIGGFVPLSAVAEVREDVGPISIDRKDQERLVKVECSPYGRDMGSVAEDIEREVAKLPLPAGVTVTTGGMFKEFRDVLSDFVLLAALAVLLVYMVMAAQYESLLHPLIIMFSLPFAATGVVWGLALMGMSLSLVSLIGILLLVGIVVKNAIVLLDYTNLLRARGLSVHDAVVQAGHNRLRPVLMTTIATLFGLMPLAFAKGEGSETWQPLGVTVIGGLSISTLITLVLIPTIYAWVEETRERWRRSHGQAATVPAAVSAESGSSGDGRLDRGERD
jgi:hydrophobe/amphiphile efflux-1 (HAE1) family protein